MLSAFIGGMRAKFPDVKNIVTPKLKELLNTAEKTTNGGVACWKITDHQNSSHLFIWDVREENEFKVSHLQLARFTPPNIGDDDLKARLENIDKNFPSQIVCYCSVGYRSSIMVQRINKIIKENAYDTVKALNLEGSIFKWANENGIIVGEDRSPVTKVHPYNWTFGKMLDSDKRWSQS